MAKRKKKPVDMSRTWEVGLGRTALARLSRDSSFHALLALCRVLNMMRFAQAGVLGHDRSESPFARRQSMISFSLTCALLYEAYQNVVPQVGKAFHASDVYRNGLGRWRSDARVRVFVEQNCKPLRRTATFHVDVSPLGSRLARIRSEWTRVLSSRGTMQGFYYYDLADTLALMAFWGDLESEKDVTARVTQLAKQATETTLEFFAASDDLISSVISEPPFRLKQGEDTKEPAWVTFQMSREGKVDEARGAARFSRRV